MQQSMVKLTAKRNLGGVSKQLDCPPILAGGVADHIHLLARLGSTITQAEGCRN